jgi:hypothetical protein
MPNTPGNAIKGIQAWRLGRRGGGGEAGAEGIERIADKVDGSNAKK